MEATIKFVGETGLAGIVLIVDYLLMDMQDGVARSLGVVFLIFGLGLVIYIIYCEIEIRKMLARTTF
jgi:hypothetical protein